MNESDESDSFITRIYSANTSTIVKIVLEKDTVITVSAPTIKEGKKTNIKVTLKDINDNILKNKKISITIKGKTYTATTNNNGIAVFNIAGLKGGKHTVTAKFAGDNNYKSSKISKVQKVNPKTNLGIVSIKKLSFKKRVSTYRVTIANKGSLKSKSTTLALFHMRNGVKIKTKYIKIKSIAPGKKISIIVSYFPDKANHRYCIAHFQIDPKNKNKEIILANNKKSISLKH
nr:Ig-like domain repeat protein [Methanobrevibacter sp. TMH8]